MLADMMSQLSYKTMSAAVDPFAHLDSWTLDAFEFSGHEIKNGLQRLSLLIDRYRCRTEALDPEQEQLIADLSRNIQLLQSSAVSWMRLAHLESSQSEVHCKRIDPVAALVEPLVRAYQGWMAERGQTCIVRADALALTLWADPELLLSVLENLLINAIRYGEQDGQIIIRIRRGAHSFDELSVWNSGQGIPAGCCEHIFERPGAGHHFPGQPDAGLGLYLARTVMDAHHGHMLCTSEAGQWVEFTCFLPQHDAAPGMSV